MEPTELKAGENLELRFLISEGVFSSVSYNCTIDKVLSQNEYLVTPPVGNDAERCVGRTLKMTVPREDAAYWAEAEVTDRISRGFSSLLHIKVTSSYTRVQRREFFRLKVALDVNLEGYGSAKTVDISGNGIALMSEINFDKNEPIKGSLNIAGKEIPISGTIVRCQSASETHNLVCIHLDDIDKSTQNDIVSFINNVQDKNNG